MLLSGQPGRGKTHLTQALINETLAQRPDLAKSIAIVNNVGLRSSTRRATYDSLTEIMNTKQQAKIVVIDDLDTSHPIASSGALLRTTLQTTICDAYDHGRYLIMATNLEPEEVRNVLLSDPTGRSLSRFDEMFPTFCTFVVEGPDMRPAIGNAITDAFGY